MKCKYCDAELAQWGGFCPVCGKNNAAEEEKMTEPEETEIFEEPVIEQPEEENGAPSATLQKSKRIAAMSGCVAVLAVLATVLFFGIRGGWDVGGMFDWLRPRENTIHYKDSYTVEDKKAVKKMQQVVATMGNEQLDNAQLQIYYWYEVYGFINENSYYLNYLGFDYSAPLDEQVCYFDPTLTWQQYFVESAIQVWQSNVALAEQARARDFVMPEEYQEELDGMEAELQKQAEKGGYDSVDAVVQESFGAGVTLADYKQYMEVSYLGYAYFEMLYEAIDPTMEDIEAYFTANEEALTKKGVKKDGSYTVDVRHILVMIDNIAAEMDKADKGTDAQAEDKDQQTESKFTEAHWAACLAAAEKIYAEWQAGDKTEEHFGELANKYSHDRNGKVTDGGIYPFVEKGEMVAEFDAWCFDKERKPGDTGLVKTQFGYHVMYFVGSEEVWITKTRSAYIADQSNKILEDLLKEYTPEINYKKIVLTDVKL